MDFDYWPTERLNRLVNALRDCEESCGRFGKRLDPPKLTDLVYWRMLADMCAVTADSDDEDDEEGALELRFASDVHAECESSHGLAQVSSAIAVGDLGSAESRLMLHLRGVKSVLYVAGHAMDPLWAKDGISYHTLLVPSAADASTALASSLGAACTFLTKNKPALICSSCPKLRATVAAALLHFESPLEMPIASAIDLLMELNLLDENEPLGAAEHSALIEFSSADFNAMGYGTMSPHMAPLSSPCVFAVPEPPGATPGKASGKLAAPPIDTLGKAFKLNPREDSPVPILSEGLCQVSTRAVRQLSEETL